MQKEKTQREKMEEEDATSPSSSSSSSSSFSTTTTTTSSPPSSSSSTMAIEEELAERLRTGNLDAQIEAARDIRKIVRKSSKNVHRNSNGANRDNNGRRISNKASTSSARALRARLAAAGVIPPLVSMLRGSSSFAPQEAALLALLNLAARNDRNKVSIVTSGAMPPLVELLKNGQLRELATATILTLSTAESNKATIAASGVAPLLVQILSSGSVQGRVDAVTALHNLCSCEEDYKLVIDARAVSPLINLVKECKKYSKFAEKTTALLEVLCYSEEGRIAFTNVQGGILALVETVEDGSLVSSEHAVGALLSLCQSCRDKFRELILGEGAIPGLLRLTAEGTPEAQNKARTLLDLLRDSPPEKRSPRNAFDGIVLDIAAQVHGTDEKAAQTAKRLLEDMVHRSMELSMSRIQLGASSCTSSRVQFGEFQSV